MCLCVHECVCVMCLGFHECTCGGGGCWSLEVILFLWDTFPNLGPGAHDFDRAGLQVRPRVPPFWWPSSGVASMYHHPLFKHCFAILFWALSLWMDRKGGWSTPLAPPILFTAVYVKAFAEQILLWFHPSLQSSALQASFSWGLVCLFATSAHTLEPRSLHLSALPLLSSWLHPHFLCSDIPALGLPRQSGTAPSSGCR